MLKKLLVTLGAVIALIAVLVIAAGVVVYNKVDKEFISSQMAGALNRQVYIEKINASIFSVISGIEVKNISISNFKTPAEIESLQGKPVEAGEAFASMESLRFKVKLKPLLKKQVELKELVLYNPVINLSKNRQGVLNIDDLLKSKKQPADKKVEEPARPISVDDIPLALAIGEIGMKNATVNYYDGEKDQRFQIYKLTTLARDIRIDKNDLEKKDEIKINISMGIKTVGTMKSGGADSFDFTIDAQGKVIPFDVKTRLMNPEAIIHLSVPDGNITGLKIFNSIAAIPMLGDYLGEYISFLKDKQHWKDSKETGLDLHYKADRAEITNGKLNLKEAKIVFDGATNIKTKAVDMNLEMVMSKAINEPVQASLAKKIESLIKNPEVKKYTDSQKLAGAAMQPLFNKDGQIYLKTKVAGTTINPEVKLVQPQLNTLGDMIKSAAGNAAVEAGKGAAKEAAKKVLHADQQKILEGVGNLFEKSGKK